jgi:hypothetical protein
MNTTCIYERCTAETTDECKCTKRKYEEFLDELWKMGHNLKTEKQLRDLGQNMRNRIREFSISGH